MRTRTEEEMYNLIISFAKKEDYIRGILLNGSRVNPNIEKDIFQDYDIVYLVTDIEPFKDGNHILSYFGEIMIMQKPENPPFGDGSCIYLMQFIDGNRIDMQFVNISRVDEVVEDSLTKVLLDKDGDIPEVSPPSEESYFIKKPNQKLYDNCCNEFIFGLGSHIPKTIWRKELPLLKLLIDVVLRKPLIQMLEWYIGIKTNYKCSIGKGGKHLKKLLEPEIWNDFKKTYVDHRYDNLWGSLFLFNKLFKKIAKYVGQTYDFKFPEKKSERALEFLTHVKRLPQNSELIFK